MNIDDYIIMILNPQYTYAPRPRDLVHQKKNVCDRLYINAAKNFHICILIHVLSSQRFHVSLQIKVSRISVTFEHQKLEK